MTITTQMHADNQCPNCHAQLDAATPADLGEAVPKAGDVTVCFYCGLPLVITDTLAVRAMAPPEFLALDAGTRAALTRAVVAVKRLRSRMN